MGVGQLSESDAVDALRLPFYSSSHPTGSHGWRNQFDLGNPEQKHPNDTVVAVTHNFTIQTVVCKVLDMPLRYSRRLRQDVGTITRLELSNSQNTLVSLNETWHLAPLNLHGGVQ